MQQSSVHDHDEDEVEEIEQPFSDEVALRIGLAARVLPDITPGDLIEALDRQLDGKIDLEGLSRITVTQLKAAFGQSTDVDGDEENERDMRSKDMAEFKEAVRILWGELTPENAPTVQSYRAGDMPGSVRVAFASNDGEDLNGHFGSAERYLVYQVSASEIRLVAVRSAALADRSEDKNTYRVGLVSDCRILYVVHVGGPAAAKVIKADIHLIQVPEGGKAREILQKLQQVIASSPPPWLKKALATSAT
jgi:nitrogen fixation protein NifX